MSARARGGVLGAHPRGLLGWLAGQSMLRRRANRARARWVTALLDLQPEDDVLEVGCGPGYALGLITRTSRGRVVGIDRSRLMIGMAGRHLRRLHSDARTTLICAAVEDIPRFDVAFEKVLSIDTWQHLAEPAGVLGILRERLAPGGRIAVAVQPRARRGDRAAAQALAAEIAQGLEAAGFQHIETHLAEGPGGRACVCVTAHRERTAD